ncbi:MAG: Lrp/AsnC family transcriptional regulator [Candidatus Nanohaloarchaea archaeon]|nr:Lrp/AsnC family transcriptional regulator [Candidatus Nanohaloarchaea archaeon]
MDKLDQEIVSILEERGRAPYTDIADELDVSEGTVRNRVEQLQEEGTIKRFTVDVAEEDTFSVVVMVDLEPGQEIDNILSALPEQLDVYEVTGEYDMVLQFNRPSSRALNEVLEDIRKVDGVQNTHTYTVLASHSR